MLGFKQKMVAQWLKKKIHIPIQETQIQPLIWDDPKCHRPTKPIHHVY